MIDRAVATDCVKRLSCLPGLPRESAGRGELVKALAESCTTPAHANAVIDQIVSGFARCPVPGDLQRVAAEMAGRHLGEEKDPCGECLDSAYVGWAYLAVPFTGEKILGERRRIDVGRDVLDPVVRRFREFVKGRNLVVYIEGRPCPSCANGKPLPASMRPEVVDATLADLAKRFPVR